MTETTPTQDTPLEEITIEQPQDSQDSNDNFNIQDLPLDDADKQEEQGAISQDAPYELSIDSAHGMDPEVKTFIQNEAKALGLPAEALSKLLNNTLSNLASNNQKMAQEAVAELRREWGAEFAQRASATKKFVMSIAREAGLSKRDEAFLSSPSGYRLMYGLSRIFGEKQVDTQNAGSLLATKEQRRAQALDMIKNRDNPYYKKINGIHVEHADRVAAWKRFNELMGASYFPER